MSDETLKIIWTKRPLERTKDISLKCAEIMNISKGPDANYYHLKINLRSGERLSFFHDYLTTRDDFKELLVALEEKFNRK